MLVLLHESVFKVCAFLSVKLLVIVIIVPKHYPSTYCLMQGSCFICSNF